MPKSEVTSGRASRAYRSFLSEGRDGTVKRLRALLERNHGLVSRTADKLGVSSRTLSRWLRHYNLQRFASQLRAENGESGRRL